MNRLLIVLLVLVANLSFGQKVKIKGDVVLVDKVEWAKIDQTKVLRDNTLMLPNGTVFCKTRGNNYLNGQVNPDTKQPIRVQYSEIKFIGTDIPVFDLGKSRASNIIKLMVNANILVDGVFNLENARAFYEEHKETCVPSAFKGERTGEF